MTLDFETYRAAAKAAGDTTYYSDAEILRLWGFMDHLVTRSVAQNCPHLLPRRTTANAAIKEAFALYSKETSGKEARS